MHFPSQFTTPSDNFDTRLANLQMNFCRNIKMAGIAFNKSTFQAPN